MRVREKADDDACLARLQSAPTARSRKRPQVARRRRIEAVSLQVAIDAGLEESRPQIDEYAEHLISSTSETAPADVMSLLDIAAYYEKIADAPAGLHTARFAYQLAESQSDLNVRRRANNVLGIAYARNYDFIASSSHLRESARLAGGLKNPLLELAALSNIVSLFDLMGLRHDADRLCSSLLAEDWAINGKGSYASLVGLQIQNSINGASVARINGDLDKARNYLETGERLAGQTATSPTFRALLANVKTNILADSGQVAAATKCIDESIAALYVSGNSQVRVALATAEANVASYSCTPVRYNTCTRRLIDLLGNAANFPPHAELLLRSLVRLHASQDLGLERSTARGLLAKLTVHQINTKHKQFYDQFGSRRSSQKSSSILLEAPKYPITSYGDWRLPVDYYFDRSVCLATSIVDEYIDQSSFEHDVRRSAESRFRSEAYRVAENWAIAADLRSGGNGRHGRSVGILAGAIALRTGYSSAEATQLDLACRLHDVGKLAVTGDRLFETSLRYADEVFVLGQHVTASAAILTGHNDATLELGSKISAAHHENWNGFGYPNCLSAFLIPEEARICAVADACADILVRMCGNIERAAQAIRHQLSAMAGVQLDPEIVKTALLIITDEKRFQDVVTELTSDVH